MIGERHEELAVLHALGFLAGEDKRGFEQAVAADPALRELSEDLRESTAALALAAPQVEPPAALKARLLAAIENNESPAGKHTTATPAQIVPFPFSRFVPWAAAAGFAFMAVWFGTQISTLRAENESLRTQRELAEVAYRMAQNQLTERTLVAEQMIAELGQRLRRTEDLGRLKITALASLVGNTPEAKAIAVWDPEQQSGLLTVEKLPAIAQEQDYQIWVIDPQYPIPVDGGVFKPDLNGKATLTFKGDKPVAQVAAFAISLEKAGGVPKAEGPLVLLGKQ